MTEYRKRPQSSQVGLTRTLKAHYYNTADSKRQMHPDFSQDLQRDGTSLAGVNDK